MDFDWWLVMKRKMKWLALTALAWTTPGIAAPAWQLGAEWGNTEHGSALTRLTVAGPRSYAVGSTGAWSWHVIPEISIGRWFDDTGDHDLWDAGLTPVLEARRLIPLGTIGVNMGIGAHLLSATRFDGNDLGSAFQFGDHVGINWQSTAGRWALGYRFQHLSNAGIAPPNEGVNFHVLHVSWRY